MSSKEKIFRLLSLVLVGIGFVAGVAGADKDGADQTVMVIEDLIHDIKKAEEVDQINKNQKTNVSASGQNQSPTVNKRN